jgi:hypothetical protein
MSRRSFLLALGILAVLAGAAGTAVLALVRYEPQRFAEAVLPPGDERTRYSQEFYTAFSQLYSDLGADREWDARFTERQINSYLSEGFVQSRLSEHLLPEHISEPRVLLEPDRVRVGFRYGSGFWSTLISVDLRLWLSGREPNVLMLQLDGFHAGALPIWMQSVLEGVSEVGRQNGIDVTWYRHDGRPVALLRFQADKPRPTLHLRAICLEDGVIHIQGSSGETPAGRAQPAAAAH